MSHKRFGVTKTQFTYKTHKNRFNRHANWTLSWWRVGSRCVLSPSKTEHPVTMHHWCIRSRPGSFSGQPPIKSTVQRWIPRDIERTSYLGQVELSLHGVAVAAVDDAAGFNLREIGEARLALREIRVFDDVGGAIRVVDDLAIEAFHVGGEWW